MDIEDKEVENYSDMEHSPMVSTELFNGIFNILTGLPGPAFF
jgi:hypothetical protein